MARQPQRPEQSLAEALRNVAQRKTGRKAKAATVALGIVLVLLTAAVVLDNWVRVQVSDFVMVKIQQALSLDKDHPVAVTVAGFSVLAQLATGSLEQISADVDNIAVGELRGGIHVSLADIPLDVQKPVGRVRVELSMPESTVAAIVTTLSATTVKQVELVEPEIRVRGEFDTPSFTLFGVTVPSVPLALAVGLEPFAQNGRLGFTPTSAEINGVSSSVEELKAKYGAVAESVLKPQSFCVADLLPQALRIDSVAVRGKQLVVSFSADNQIRSTDVLSTHGSCT